jgi:uncharacterized alkaline shock family protein YloU
MKLKYTFETVDMSDEIIAVPVGEDAKELKGVVKLNRAGQEIFSLLKNDTTEEKIVDALAAKYENSRENLAAYVRQMLETLRSDGLLAE